MKKITIYYAMTLMALAVLFFFLQWKVAKDARASRTYTRATCAYATGSASTKATEG
ncbi:hypothetical protein [Porphyromonas somerae]|uniref:hypothetical protein n=1 Tax=Porphyromonas somerae TaxID=322095 RepID=UPI002A820D4B|nr:hypothetical protein [Porphyromonas somerae]MDY3883883.1 hypothetical protein [Porphyromonas somerae]